MGRSVYIVAGEVSGDIHAADLLRGMLALEPDLEIHGLGGPEVQALAPQVENWLERAAVMGVVEVLKNYSFFKEKLETTVQDVLSKEPDFLILVDYPGFNLRLAERVKAANPDLRVVQYVCPQVWAWKKGRIPKIAASVDQLLCLFPFEPKLFDSYKIDAQFVGHPLVDELAEKRLDVSREENLIGLFPGSRKREIESLFPVMLAAAENLAAKGSGLRFEVPAASPELATRLEAMIAGSALNISITQGGSHSLMQRASCGVLASGTATLEAAYFGLPYCLMYKLAWLNYQIAKVVVTIRFIGIVNILEDRQVVREFIQDEANAANVEEELARLLENAGHRAQVEEGMRSAVSKLGKEGVRGRLAEVVLGL